MSKTSELLEKLQVESRSPTKAGEIAQKMYKHILQAQGMAHALNKHLAAVGVKGQRGAVGGRDIGKRLYNIQQDLLAITTMRAK